jgi:hypothetical protein
MFLTSDQVNYIGRMSDLTATAEGRKIYAILKTPTPAKFKITDDMVEAAVLSFYDGAKAEGRPQPTEEESPREWAKVRKTVRKALTAAARAI